jgi:phage baseplate assembly protein W
MAVRYGSWRFVHPDLAAGVPAGLQISRTGGIELVHGDESVHQAILLLLSTRPGERVMRPSYGCDLSQFMFAPNDDTTAGLAIHYVRQALARWEPRIEVLSLDAGRSPDDASRMEILLQYRIRATQQPAQLNLALNLAPGA